MDKNEFLDLELQDQVNYLNGLVDEGKSIDEIVSATEISQREMGALGIYFVRNKFMGKPMRGYQTAKRSGNESKASGDGWRIEGSAPDVPLA